MPINDNPRVFKTPIILPYIIVIIGTYLISVPFLQVTSYLSEYQHSYIYKEFDIGYFFAIGWILLGLILKLIIQQVSFLRSSVENFTKTLEEKINLVQPEE